MKKLVVLIILMASFLLAACEAGNDLMLVEAWARPAASGFNSALYFHINNRSANNEALLRKEIRSFLLDEDLEHVTIEIEYGPNDCMLAA